MIAQTAHEQEIVMSRTFFSSRPGRRGTYCPQFDTLESRDAPGSLHGPGVIDPGSSGEARDRQAAQLAILAGIAASSQGTTKTTSPVVDFATRSIVFGESTLTRTDHGITMHLKATGVPAGAYSGWIPIFNPGDTVPVAAGWVAGHVVGRGGQLTFSVHLNEGESLSGHPVFPSGSLQDARRQEIRMVVRYHGPADPGRIHEQSHTFELGVAVDFLVTIHAPPP